MVRVQRSAFYDNTSAFGAMEAIENRQLDSINVAAAWSNTPDRV